MTHDTARQTTRTTRAQLLAEQRTRDLKLSILMPAYNEDHTIVHAVEAVLSQQYPCPVELIVVDDGSRRPVEDFLATIRDPRLRIHRHPVNLGKGAALRQAAALATGTHMVPFDADLEYDPADLAPMLMPVIEGRSHVVYGTRLFGVNTRYQSYIHGFSNRALTLVANLVFDAYISDLHTCLKLMPLDVFRSFSLGETGFGLDTEITAWLLRAGLRPFEVPVSYHSRSKHFGKKIDWRDGIQCLRVLARVRRAPRPELALDFNEPLHGRLAAMDPLDALADALAEDGPDAFAQLGPEVAAAYPREVRFDEAGEGTHEDRVRAAREFDRARAA